MADNLTLRLHHLEPASRANGPGLRAVVWFQGCTLGCPGCFNPLTHPQQGRKIMAVEQVVAEIRAIDQPIEGITISGGEPFQQSAALVELLTHLRQQTQLNVLVFTGYTWDELQRMPAARPVLPLMDVLLAGRYELNHRQANALLGSTNKTIHFLTDCYSQADLDAIPSSEVLIDLEGNISVTGIDPLTL